jgi:hypothetical protein
MKPPLQLTFLAQLGNGVVLYGLEYPGLYGCCSWCHLTIAKNVIIATQPEKDCGTSLTNIWCQEFIEVLSDLPAIKAAGEGTTLRWLSTTTAKILPSTRCLLPQRETPHGSLALGIRTLPKHGNN